MLGDAAAMIVVDVDGFGASRDDGAVPPSDGCDNRDCDMAHAFTPWIERSAATVTHGPLAVNRANGAIWSAAAPHGARKKSLIVFWLKRGVLQRGHPKAIVSILAWRRYGALFL
jgi:hypothetical protein